MRVRGKCHRPEGGCKRRAEAHGEPSERSAGRRQAAIGNCNGRVRSCRGLTVLGSGDRRADTGERTAGDRGREGGGSLAEVGWKRVG
jgi:hypothetical protein